MSDLRQCYVLEKSHVLVSYQPCCSPYETISKLLGSPDAQSLYLCDD